MCNYSQFEGRDGTIKVSIKDNGIGIKKEDQENLFKLFGFLESNKKLNTKGVGLGLHICLMIVKQFGSEIKVDSTYEVGSTFSFKFRLSSLEEGSDPNDGRLLNPVQIHDAKI